MVTIAVDAMGGDHAPKAEVEGAIRAARSLGVRVILVGKQDIVRAELAQHDGIADLPIEVQHASEQITMEDSAAKAVRTKRDSSMRVAARLVRDGIARRLRVGRQHRRRDGHRQDGPGHASGRGSAGARVGVSRRSRARRWWWWTWAPTWIARRACWRSSP